MSDRIRPSDLPYKGDRPMGVGFCKDNDGNLIWDGGDSFSGVITFPDLASFQAAGGAAAHEGPVWIGEELVYYPGDRKTVDTIPDQIEVTFGTGFENLTANRITGGGITATLFANRFNYGTEIGWNAGTVMANGHFVGLFKRMVEGDIRLYPIDFI